MAFQRNRRETIPCSNRPSWRASSRSHWLLPAAAQAQTNQQLDEIRKQIQEMKDSYDKRIQALEKQLKEAEDTAAKAQSAATQAQSAARPSEGECRGGVTGDGSETARVA